MNRTHSPAPAAAQQQQSLADCVRRMLEQCPTGPDGVPPPDLHALVVQCVERPLFAWALEKTGNNQTAAARLLGINRNTLHRKLTQYDML